MIITISVSGNKVTSDLCKIILSQFKIQCSISSQNISHVENSVGEFVWETSVKIEFYKLENKKMIKSDIWPMLKAEMELDCAHVAIPGDFHGCIYDWFADSKCPFCFIT